MLEGDRAGGEGEKAFEIHSFQRMRCDRNVFSLIVVAIVAPSLQCYAGPCSVASSFSMGERG